MCQKVAEKERLTWEANGFEVVEAPIASLLRSIVLIANTPRAAVGRAMDRFDGRQSPYKHLDYFERHETELFFGREREIQRLVHMVSAHRVVVLTGPSGAGKTSLLNAGLLAWTDQTSAHSGVYARCGNDPMTSIAEAISNSMNIEVRLDRDDDTLSEFLSKVRDESRSVPIIVLDQAEEL